MNNFDLWFSLLNVNPKAKLKMLQQFKSTENIWQELLKSNVYKQQYDSKKIDMI